VKFYHCSSSQLAPGGVIQPGNWGRIIRSTGWAHNQAFKEAALEHLRATEFPDKPPRLMSSFFFDSEDEARFYGISDGRQTTMIPYEVELIDPLAPRHTADWRAVSPAGTVDSDWSRTYWLGTSPPPPPQHPGIACREVIAVTPLKIVRPI